MANGNNITIVGNCTRDVELRFTANGQAVAQFGIAVNRRWQNRSTQEWEEAVSFFDVTAWAQLGENAVESISKGDRVIVTGRLEQESYETREGEKRSKVKIVADDIGPSLRWATAQTVRNERSDNQGNYDRGANTPGPAAAAAQSAPAQSYPNDEEPF